MKKIFESEYLNKKLELRRDLPEDLIPDKYNPADYENFGEHSYVNENGKFEFKIGETEILLQYSKPALREIFSDMPPSIDFFSFLDLMRKDVRDIMARELKDIRIIDQIVIKNKDACLDSKEILFNKDKLNKIYFNFPGKLNARTAINTTLGVISLSKDPLSPSGLLSLLHEIGHYQNSEQKGESYSLRLIGSKERLNDPSSSVMDEDDAELILKEERTAWAYALKSIRPFIKNLVLKLDGLNEFIHGKCLYSYSENIYLQKQIVNDNANLAKLEEIIAELHSYQLSKKESTHNDPQKIKLEKMVSEAHRRRFLQNNNNKNNNQTEQDLK